MTLVKGARMQWLPCCCVCLTVLAISLPGVAPQAYTLRSSGKSFLEYRTQWQNLDEWGIQFSFRTKRANTFLLHQSFVEVEGESFNYELELFLRKGELHARHVFNSYREEISIAKGGVGLNHDRWHEVTVMLDTTIGNLTVTVDNRAPRSLILKAYTHGQAGDTINKLGRSGIVHAGGFSEESLKTPSRFVGCIQDVRFIQGERAWSKEPFKHAFIEKGCNNMCETENPCQSDGVCINHYTRTSCDCFDTKHEGHFCEKEGVTILTLEGEEWLTYNIYEQGDQSYSPANQIALQFKTKASEGILFYGRGEEASYNHLGVSLHNAAVHVSVVFADQQNFKELLVSLGHDLNDDKWHSLVVSHQGRDVRVTLDREQEKMSAEGKNHHLHLNPLVFFGGGDIPESAMGLRTNKKFRGCIRSIYFNHVPILEQLGTSLTTFHGGLLQYGCLAMSQSSLQFSHSGTLVKVEHSPSDQLLWELQFRTLRPSCVLAYTEMTSLGERGYVQLILRQGRLVLELVPSTLQQLVHESVSIPGNFANNIWHSVRFGYHTGVGQLIVDEMSKVLTTRWQMHMLDSTYLGFGPETDIEAGYVGCMRSIKIQGHYLDPVDDVLHSGLAIGVTIGSCDFKDWCHVNGSQCQNGGQCVWGWSSTKCDCSNTQYIGKLCQFPKLKRSCDEYYQAGMDENGVYAIDVDGSEYLTPGHVYCDMGVEKDGKLVGVTRVDHNLRPGTNIRAKNIQDHRMLLQYREMSWDHLTKLVYMSSGCRQFMEFYCSRAPLRLDYETWFFSSNGSKVTSLGSSLYRGCWCGDDKSCLDKRVRCNCDQRSKKWNKDGGFLTRREDLPISEMVFLQKGGNTRKSNITLGPLECWGQEQLKGRTEVMFTDVDVTHPLPGWRGGSIEWEFKTSDPSAVLMYQEGHKDQPTELSISLQNDNLLEIIVGPWGFQNTIKTSKHLSDGHWHRVAISIAMAQIHVVVDKDNFLYDLPFKRPKAMKKRNNLHVGGYPKGALFVVRGLRGCVRAVIYNGRPVKFSEKYIKKTKGLEAECQASCDKDVCMNGAECEEHWTSYACHCKNRYAESGQHCEHNLNEDSLSFLDPESFVRLENLGNDPLLHSSMLFSFRTKQTSALVFYMYDEFNNFLQLEVRGEDLAGILFNDGTALLEVNITVPGLSRGEWQQVVVETSDASTRVQVGSGQAILASPRTKITNYTQVPFKKESVTPFRTVTQPSEGHVLYIGGSEEGMTPLPGLQGCFAGLKISHKTFSLQSASTDMESVILGCVGGCDHARCHNRGVCIDWGRFDGQYFCDCTSTGWAGRHCDQEYGIWVEGKSWVEQEILTEDKGGYTESLFFSFATTQTGIRNRGIVFIRGKSTFDEDLLVYMTAEGGIGAHFGHYDPAFQRRFHETVELGAGLHDGKAHRVEAHREYNYLRVKVDEDTASMTLNSSANIKRLHTILVGGVRSENYQFTEFDNFTGAIANVFLKSDQLKRVSVRPLEAYHTAPGRVKVLGRVAISRSSLMETAALDPSNNSGLVQVDGVHISTFPPWNPGPARTVSMAQAQTSEEGYQKPSAAFAYIVCIGFLLAFGGGITFIIVRAWRRKKMAPSGKDMQDEEVGLITITEDSPPTGDTGIPDREIPVIKLRQWDRLKGKDETATDTEDEETPMLLNGNTGGAMEMVTYSKKLEPLDGAGDEATAGHMDLLQPPVPAPASVEVMTHAPPSLLRHPDSDQSGRGDAMTESQVLDLLEQAEAQEELWDHMGDTNQVFADDDEDDDFVDAREKSSRPVSMISADGDFRANADALGYASLSEESFTTAIGDMSFERISLSEGLTKSEVDILNNNERSSVATGSSDGTLIDSSEEDEEEDEGFNVDDSRKDATIKKRDTIKRSPHDTDTQDDPAGLGASTEPAQTQHIEPVIIVSQSADADSDAENLANNIHGQVTKPGDKLADINETKQSKLDSSTTKNKGEPPSMKQDPPKEQTA